jgi:hypothetical protein
VPLLIGEPESLSQSHVFLAAVCASRGDFLSCGRFHSQVWSSSVSPPPPIFVVFVDPTPRYRFCRSVLPRCWASGYRDLRSCSVLRVSNFPAGPEILRIFLSSLEEFFFCSELSFPSHDSKHIARIRLLLKDFSFMVIFLHAKPICFFFSYQRFFHRLSNLF